MCPLNGTESDLSSELRLFHAIASTVLAVAGTLGNALSIMLIYRGQLYLTGPTMLMIINLCVANLISSAIILPIIAGHSFAGYWTSNTHFCRAFGYILYVALTSEGIILTDIGLTQYLVIVHRVSNNTIMYANHRLYFFLLVSMPWVICLLLFLVPLTEVWDKFGYDPRRGYCTIINLQDGLGFQGAVVIFFIATMSITIFYCYPAIYWVDFKSRQRTTTSVMEAVARFRGRSRQSQLVKMIVAIIANFVCTYLPFMIVSVVDPCVEKTPLALYTAVLYLCWSHAATNPIIYALINRRINAMWRNLFPCCQSGEASPPILVEHLKPRSDTISGC